MKYLFIILIAGCYIGKITAQGNLQFNQVKIVYNTDPTQTVPTGKVWKIESVFFSGEDVVTMNTNGSNTSPFSACGLPTAWYYHYGRYLAINNVPISFGVLNVGAHTTQLPIWLPAGSTICTCLSTTFCAKGYSVIEFNVVP